MSKLHIVNTYFEAELAGITPHNLYQAVHQHSIPLQLQFLPYLYAKSGDGILLSNLPDQNYSAVRKKWNLPTLTPHLIENPALSAYDEIESWGASQLIHTWALKHHIPYVMPQWHIVREVNSKSYSFLHAPRLPEATLIHKEEELNKWLALPFFPKVLKTIFGLSGAGHLLIDSTTPFSKILHFLKPEWDLGRAVLAEPWVTRLLDFSTQWKIHPDKSLDYLGATICENDQRGMYRGTRVGDPTILFGPHFPFLEEQKAVAQPILHTMAAQGYFGNVGIDAMVYFHPEKKSLYLHPIVEINARKTMGLVALLFQQTHFPKKQLAFCFASTTEGLLPSSLTLSPGKEIKFKRNLIFSIQPAV